MSPRLVAVPLAAAFPIAALAGAPRHRWRPALFAWALFMASSAAPIDLRGRVGHPRVVAVVAGLPTPEARQAAERGEIDLAGDVVPLNAPRSMGVW